MFKAISIFGFVLIFACSGVVNAHELDDARVLENEVDDIKRRLTVLEALIVDLNNAQELVSKSGDRRLISEWRKLSRDMSMSEVRDLLGEPDTVNGGSFTDWQYKNGGRVIFYKEKVDRWIEPRK